MSLRPALTCDEVRDLAPMFVTGALDPDEMDAIREHLAGCEDAHAELSGLGEAATALLASVEPVEPPAALRSRLLAAAEADLAEGRHPASAPAPVPAPVIDLDEERARRRSRLGWLLAAAAAIAVIALGGWNLALQRDLAAAQAYRNGVAQALEAAAEPGALTAFLAAEDGSVSGLGVVATDGTVHLAMRGLAGTTGTQVYTAWAIASEGAPVPIGEFTVGADGVAVATARVAAAIPGTTLALTLEAAPGATTPTLPIVAAGVAGPASG
ncbi:MAG: hypothetical protein A2V85_10920 [Chloroflexi bacterium RBG_16_72_14]|nr:MAG: hypothetical protein A2V85_10920 [Chloroflexi bacterium RBG_16_72_14]